MDMALNGIDQQASALIAAGRLAEAAAAAQAVAETELEDCAEHTGRDHSDDHSRHERELRSRAHRVHQPRRLRGISQEQLAETGDFDRTYPSLPTVAGMPHCSLS